MAALLTFFLMQSSLPTFAKSTVPSPFYCNAGSRTTNKIEHRKNYGDVWFEPHAIANILSLARGKNKFRVNFYSKTVNAFLVPRPDGDSIIIKESAPGLYFYNATDNALTFAQPTSVEDTTAVPTVSGNTALYSAAQINQDRRACAAYTMLGRPPSPRLCKPGAWKSTPKLSRHSCRHQNC